ncbi:MAG: NAD(P)H-dependent glycerol-3-phosphate dehydrogenase [Bacteroidales bacterium]|jgi:glycerol-3-phosphate dehydrogenase (NAD(P)+)|nr:NAD(P)H-dependent glycerol-3-phosphate dehydrogenase [Bacteroidales bacterium]
MNKSKAKVAVIGGGSWATAIAKMLLENKECINWYLRSEDNIKRFKLLHHNPGYLSTVFFETNRIHFSSDLNEVIRQSDILIFAVPSPFLKSHLEKLTVSLSDKIVISAIKGIVPDENMVMGEYFETFFNVPKENFAVIAGPCHAEEIGMERLSYITIGCTNSETARSLSQMFSCRYVKTSITTDAYGAEYSAVMKNIIALACGICHGLKFGDNFQAVLVSNGIQEIDRFLEAVSPTRRDTKGSVYLGDLMVTSYSQFSRNRTFGTMIGRGYSVKNAMMEMIMIAEGYYGVKCIKEMNAEYNVVMPIMESVFNIIYERISPAIEMKILTDHLR